MITDGHWILAINPGSTSTKMSLFKGDSEIHSMNVTHAPEDLEPFSSVMEQENYRYKLVCDLLDSLKQKEKIPLGAVIGRGGLLHPLEGGIYRVSPAMVEDLRSARYGEHASNLGGILARRLADSQSEGGCEAFVADPVVVDELCDEARLSGMPELERKSIFHALNQKSTAREVAASLGKSYEELNLIVAHMGGGISVGAHSMGKVIDVNNALDGEGPFSPERSGSLPAGQLALLVHSRRFTLAELKKKITGAGGIFAYCGTKDLRDVLEKIDKGSKECETVYKAMILQIAKEIAQHGATLKGKVDGIVLTGGLAYSKELIKDLKIRLEYLAPVHVIPGEREMAALAGNALAALKGERPVMEYEP